MKTHKTLFVMVFALGLAAGLYLANYEVMVISPIAAQSGQDEPMVSPVGPRDRDFYAPNSEKLGPDEMRVIACGTGGFWKGHAANPAAHGGRLSFLQGSRPMDEWADSFLTSSFGSHTQWVGDHYYSNTPWVRPLLTLTRDTVDNENMKKMYGERAAHSYVLHNGACNSGLYETLFGTVNAYSCHVGLAQGMLEIAGEEVARRFIHPAAFMHFQCIAFDKIPTALTYFSGRDVIKPGDFVELLAHEDLYVAISPCPLGDQHDMTAIENCTCYSVRIAIYEGEDGPLEAAPDPQRKTMNAVDFVKAGRPGMVVGKVGKKES